MFSLSGSTVWVAGHGGLVGGALLRRLPKSGARILTAPRDTYDLREQLAVDRFVRENRPEAVILAAARVGGIEANRTRPAEFLYDNLAIAANVIHAAAEHGVAKLVFLGSSCFYPREAVQPIREEELLQGPFEPTNQWYAVAKVAGAKLCQAYRQQYGKDFIVAVPTNLYGPGDNFDLAASHVIPAMIRKFYEAGQSGAASVQMWGTGSPLREFLHVDDAADAIVFLLERYSSAELINIAGGETVSIRELAETAAVITGFRGSIEWDTSKPDGMPKKALAADRIQALGWRPRIRLHDGLTETFTWYRDHVAKSGSAILTR
jgi:GDP-L-fucose synthase